MRVNMINGCALIGDITNLRNILPHSDELPLYEHDLICFTVPHGVTAEQIDYTFLEDQWVSYVVLRVQLKSSSSL